MGIVLADSAPGLQDVVDRGVGRRATRGVLEELVEPRLEIAETGRGGPGSRYPAGLDEPRQRRRGGSDEPARLKHQSHIERPRGFVRGLAAARFDLDLRTGDDTQPVVPGMAIEEVSPVPPGIQELGDGAGGLGLEGKVAQLLAPIHQR